MLTGVGLRKRSPLAENVRPRQVAGRGVVGLWRSGRDSGLNFISPCAGVCRIGSSILGIFSIPDYAGRASIGRMFVSDGASAPCRFAAIDAFRWVFGISALTSGLLTFGEARPWRDAG